MSDRDLLVGIDAGGGGAGGGSSGAGGGSWSVVGRGGGLPEEPDPDIHTTADARSYVLDRFNDRTVAPPSTTPGDAIGGGGAHFGLRRGVDIDEVTMDGPQVFLNSAGHVGSWIGHSPAYVAPKSHRGWWEYEEWWYLTVPAHPASMAGIRAALGLFHPQGYGAVDAFDVVVLPSAPTDIRQGSVVGIIPADGALHTFTIPGVLVPAAGAALHIGLRARWSANLGARATSYSWPYASHPSLYDSDGIRYQGRSGRAQILPLGSVTWLTWTSGSSDIGSPLDPGPDAPYDALGPWADIGSTGTPIIEVDPATGLSVSATAPGAGERAFDLVIVAEGLRAQVSAHLIAGAQAVGISADGGGIVDHEAIAIAADTRYALILDTRTGDVRGKLWAWQGLLSEPARFDVRADLEPSEILGDRLELWFRLGATTQGFALRGGEEDDTAGDGVWSDPSVGCRIEAFFTIDAAVETITVRRILVQAGARIGDRVEHELVGIVPAGGLGDAFPTAHPYEPGSVVAALCGIAAVPNREWPQDARFGLDLEAVEGTIIRASYIVAGGDVEDEA